MEKPEPDTDLVSVLETTETGLLPLAQMALDQAGIEYTVQNRGFADQILGHRSSMTVGELDTPLVVLVRAEDEARARDVLRDLTTADSTSIVPPPAAARPATRAPSGPAAVDLFDVDSSRRVGGLTEAQFASLAAQLVRESETDDDYYIDEATLTMLADQGVDPDVVSLLRDALAGRSEMTVRWKRAESRP